MSRVLIVDDSDTGIIYTGTWISRTVLGTLTNEYNTTVHQSGPSGEFSYTFFGTSISLYGTLDTPTVHGVPKVSFSIDGVTSAFNETGQVRIEYGGDATSHVLMYQSPDLEPKNHTLTVKTSPTVDPAAVLYFDFLTVKTGSNTASGNIIVDDRDPAVVYNGSWSNTGAVVEYGTTTRRCDNGTATFRFNGTAMTVYATISTSTNATTRTSVAFSLDGGPNTVYNGLQIQDRLRHEPIFHVDGLSTTQGHTVVMSSLSSMSWYLDYIVYQTEAQAMVATTDSGAGVGATSSPNIGLVAGGVVAGIVGLLAIAGIIFMLMRRQRSRDRELGNESARAVSIMPSADTHSDAFGGLHHHKSGRSAVSPTSMSQFADRPLLHQGPSGGSSYSAVVPAWSQHADAEPGTGQQEQFSPMAIGPGPVFGQQPRSHPFYPQFSSVAATRARAPSSSDSTSIPTSPNERATVQSASPNSQFLHMRSMSDMTHEVSVGAAPSTVYSAEEDSGIRIPRTSPPVYTPD